MKHHRQYGRSIVIGLFFILLGIAGVLNNLDIVHIGSIWNLWPAMFLLMGLSRLLGADTPFDRPEGIFWIFMSLYFFVSQFRLWDMSYHNAWPILLIGIGISMAWKSLIRSHTAAEVKEA